MSSFKTVALVTVLAWATGPASFTSEDMLAKVDGLTLGTTSALSFRPVQHMRAPGGDDEVWSRLKQKQSES